MEKSIRLLYPNDYTICETDRLTDFEFIQTLSIDEMIRLKRDHYLGVLPLELSQFFSANPRVLSYRLEVMEDIIEQPSLYELLLKIQPFIQNIYEMRKIKGENDTVESNLYSIKTLEYYIETMELLEKGFSAISPNSEGMKQLKQKVVHITESKEYQNLKTESEKMRVKIGHIKSITVGINIDGTLHAKNAGVISINTEEYTEGNLIERLLKIGSQNPYTCMTSLTAVKKGMSQNDQNALNASLQFALNSIFNKTIRSWEMVIHNYFIGSTDFLIEIFDDIRFLTAAAAFILQMKQKGLFMCKPEIYPMEEKRCTLTDVYNPMVSLKTEEETIICNDFCFDNEGMIYIITEPNHGGKSVFAYSIGMAQALFQLGLYVPAKEAKMSPVSNLFTHFPSSDENNYGKGRLESECARLSEILKKVTKDSMIILDEAFSSTSGEEAGFIAGEVLTGLGVIGCRGLFVTHIHDLPHKAKKFNSYPNNQSKIDNLAAQMENKEDGTRSYKIFRTMPDGLSYASDIAKKYGLELESIIKKRSS